MDRLFVYGIFLGETMRERYGMFNPRYATVRGYTTYAVTTDGYIVEAAPVESRDMMLTGLIVDVDPEYWERIDGLEAGYKRVEITTSDGYTAYMYARKD